MSDIIAGNSRGSIIKEESYMATTLESASTTKSVSLPDGDEEEVDKLSPDATVVSEELIETGRTRAKRLNDVILPGIKRWRTSKTIQMPARYDPNLPSQMKDDT